MKSHDAPDTGTREQRLVQLRMVEQMRRLMEHERRAGGLNPRDMTEEQRARYLQFGYSAVVIASMAGRELKRENAAALLQNVRHLVEMPQLRDRPLRHRDNRWRNVRFSRNSEEMLLDRFELPSLGSKPSMLGLCTTGVMAPG